MEDSWKFEQNISISAVIFREAKIRAALNLYIYDQVGLPISLQCSRDFTNVSW